jgi:hypothetical protein
MGSPGRRVWPDEPQMWQEIAEGHLPPPPGRVRSWRLRALGRLSDFLASLTPPSLHRSLGRPTSDANHRSAFLSNPPPRSRKRDFARVCLTLAPPQLPPATPARPPPSRRITPPPPPAGSPSWRSASSPTHSSSAIGAATASAGHSTPREASMAARCLELELERQLTAVYCEMDEPVARSQEAKVGVREGRLKADPTREGGREGGREGRRRKDGEDGNKQSSATRVRGRSEARGVERSWGDGWMDGWRDGFNALRA